MLVQFFEEEILLYRVHSLKIFIEFDSIKKDSSFSFYDVA